MVFHIIHGISGVELFWVSLSLSYSLKLSDVQRNQIRSSIFLWLIKKVCGKKISMTKYFHYKEFAVFIRHQKSGAGLTEMYVSSSRHWFLVYNKLGWLLFVSHDIRKATQCYETLYILLLPLLFCILGKIPLLCTGGVLFRRHIQVQWHEGGGKWINNTTTVHPVYI